MKTETEHREKDTKLILLINEKKILLFGINEMLLIKIIHLFIKCKSDEN